MKIVVVDDSRTMQRLIRKTLEDLGHQDVLTCGSGQEALEIVIREQPELVLLDWHMPVMSGLDLLRTLKDNEHTRHIPVIMLTVERSAENVSLAIECGAEGYILKPVNTEILRARLEDIASRHTLGLKK